MVGRLLILFSLSILLVVLTRLPLMPAYLYSFDSVNLALALSEFNPVRSQPQLPGYSFFVLEARLLHTLLGTPERTFTILKILISGLSVGVLYLLVRRMLGSWVGALAAALLLVNPVFWFSGLTSPLRPHLALFSILVAYCCWRAGAREGRFFYAASMALGLAGGFRPTLVVLLLPLWLWSAWQIRRWKVFWAGSALVILTSLAWMAVLVAASGGLQPLLDALREYFLTQTQQTSILLGATAVSWRHMVGRALVWTGVGALPWLWTVPFGWFGRHGQREWKRCLGFLALWFAPGFLFHVFVHIGDPDHALSTIPVLCVLGAFCLAAAERSLGRLAPDLKERGLIAFSVLLGSSFLFLVEMPLPQSQTRGEFRGLASVRDAFLFGTYETSYARVRWVDQMADLALRQIEKLKSGTGRPIVLVWARDGEPVWRKAAFYLPREKLYALEEGGDPAALKAQARLWMGSRVLAEYREAPPFRLPVPRGARLIWLMGRGDYGRIKEAVATQEALPLYYTDLPENAPPFGWGSFQFVPQ